MSYAIYPARGVVVRIADGVVVAPAQSVEDPDYLAYVAWVEAGNAPALGVEPDPTPRILTKLAFRRRFTLAERIAMDGAPDNPALPAEARAALRTMARDLELAEEIDLDDSDVIAGLALLEQLGIIASGRAAEVRA